MSRGSGISVHDNGNNHVAICDEDANGLMAEELIVQMTANFYRCLGSLLIESSGGIVKIAERLWNAGLLDARSQVLLSSSLSIRVRRLRC